MACKNNAIITSKNRIRSSNKNFNLEYHKVDLFLFISSRFKTDLILGE